MKIIMIILFGLLFVLPVCAGTFVDNFDDNDLGTWVIDPLSEKVEIVNGEVIVADLNGDASSGLYFNGEQKIADFVVSFDGKATRLFGSPYMWLLYLF